jgi:microsomal dipeptidase-like Zn-dependent dipeptidase
LQIGNVERGLRERNYTLGEVDKLMGGNWLRLYGEVWKK